MKLFQLTNSIALKLPSVLGLFARGLGSFGQHPTIKAEVTKYIENDIVLIGFEDNEPTGFCIVKLPFGLQDVPQVVHIHSEGSRAFTRALVSLTLDTVKKKGYTKLRAINGSKASDAVWQRTFRHKDWSIKPVKTVFDFEVTK